MSVAATDLTQQLGPIVLRGGPLSEGEHRTLAGTSARRLGAYYTPPVAARYMAHWALRGRANVVLEPSVGAGEFVRAVQGEVARTGASVDLWGVELAQDTYRQIVETDLLEANHAIHHDFLALSPFPVNVVIGNPPYVRLRHLPATEAKRARQTAHAVMGEEMDPAGSVWMPFVLHASEFLVPGGRLAFVLPYDLTYVRYARPLWRHLAARFGDLRVIRFHQRVFPELLQEVVILLADGRGAKTDCIRFEAFRRSCDLETGTPLRSAIIPIDRVVDGERAFLEALLPDPLAELLQDTIATGTRPVRETVTFNIGYVAGDKRFFHPDPRTVERYQLPKKSLVQSLTSARRVRGAGLYTSGLATEKVDRLFLPPTSASRLAPGEVRYIAKGRRDGVHQRYKTSVRDPWYVTPGVKKPDLIVPVFAERPLLLINDADYVASNSLLTGYLVNSDSAASVAAAWYTTLTLLQIELNVHSLGGGVMIVVPREAGNIRLVTKVRERSHLRSVETRLRAGEIDAAYRSGDTAILKQRLNLDEDQIELVRAGVDVLRQWRTMRSPEVALT